MAFASLTIDLNAKLASFERDLGRMAHVAERNAQQMQAAFARVGSALALIGGSVAGAGFGAIFKQAIDSAAALDDLAEKTGASVEELSKLERVARIDGTSIDVLQTALVQLTKRLNETGETGENAERALRQLGLKAADLRQLDTGVALKQIADQLARFQDGAGKTAVAIDLLGRSGAEALPYLKDLATFGEQSVTVTAQQAAESEKLANSMRELSAHMQDFARSISLQVVPSLNAMIEKMALARRAGAGILDSLVAGFRGSGVESRTTEEIRARITELLSRDKNTSFGGLFGFLKRGRGEAAEAELAVLQAELQRRLAEASEAAIPPPPPAGALPQLFGRGGEARAAGGKPVDQFRAQKEAVEAIHAQAIAAAEADQEIQKLRDHYTDIVEPAAKVMREMREFEAIAPALGLSADEIERIRDVFRDRIDAEQFGNKLKDITEEAKKQKDIAEDLGLTFSSAFEDAIVAGKSFGDVLRSIAQDVLKLFVRKSITEPAGNFLTDLFGKIFGGGKAMGGPVSAGTPYLVGERGPELFVPRTSGTIVPNGGVGGVTLQQTVTIDARGADAGVEARIRRAMREAQESTLAAVQTLANRGGSFASAVGRR